MSHYGEHHVVLILFESSSKTICLFVFNFDFVGGTKDSQVRIKSVSREKIEEFQDKVVLAISIKRHPKPHTTPIQDDILKKGSIDQ